MVLQSNICHREAELRCEEDMGLPSCKANSNLTTKMLVVDKHIRKKRKKHDMT